MESGLTALHWMAHGIGFELSEADVITAYDCTLKSANRLDRVSEAETRVRDTLARIASNKKIVGRVVGRLFENGPR